MSQDLAGPVAPCADLARLFTRGSEFHMRMRGRVKRLVWTTGLPVHMKEDLFQDLAVAMLRAYPKYDPARGTLEVFLAGVMRKWYLWQKRELSRKQASAPLGDLWDDGEAAAAADECRFRAARALVDDLIDLPELLDRLPPDLREFAVLLSRHTIPSIAKITGEDRTTVWRRFKRLQAAAEALVSDDCNDGA